MTLSSPSDGYPYRKVETKIERADPMRSETQGQYSQSLSKITGQVKHGEGLSDRFDDRPQSQSLTIRNNPHYYSQPPASLSNDRNMLFSSPSNGYTSHEAERASSARFQIQGQHGQSLSGITDQMKYREGTPDRLYANTRSQSFKNNPHNYSQPPANLSSGRDMQYLLSSDDYPYRKIEKANSMKSKTPRECNQPSSRNNDKMQYNEGLPYGFYRSGQSQSFRNNPHSYSQPPANLSSARDMQSLPSSDDYPYRKIEKPDPTRFQSQEKHGQSLSKNTIEIQHYEGLPYGFDNRSQSQSLRNNSYNKSQPPTHSFVSIEIDPNSRNQEPMLTNSATKNNQSDRIRHNSTSSNSRNGRFCNCTIL